MPASQKHWPFHRSLRHSLSDSFIATKMTIVPKPWVPHLRDGFIVAKVGIVRSTTAPAHLARTPVSQATH
jgi:hypothetical protein